MGGRRWRCGLLPRHTGCFMSDRYVLDAVTLDVEDEWGGLDARSMMGPSALEIITGGTSAGVEGG